MTALLESRTRHALAEIQFEGLCRRLAVPAGIDLSSNDYLGLSADKRVVDAATIAIESDGLGSTGSRLLRGQRPVFDQAEKIFAAWKGTESSLFFASGYHANLGVLTTFVGNNDVVFSDELNHASLIDGIRLSKGRCVVFKHRDVDAVAALLRNCSTDGQKYLVTESLFSMDGDVAPLGDYADICRETNTALIVDEAHAVGIFGRCGSGLIEDFDVTDQIFLSINTGGKALGVSGAFVAGPEWAIDYLIQTARAFIFSTAPSPMVPAALLRSIEIIRSDVDLRKKLFDLSRTCRQLLIDHGFALKPENLQTSGPIIPIRIGSNARAADVAKRLQDKGFDTRAIRPPTVANGTSRLRISINVSLSEPVLDDFVTELTKLMIMNAI